MTPAALRASFLVAVSVALALQTPGAASRILIERNLSQPILQFVPLTCLSVECVSLAAQMTSRMNISADPCQDFYNYACGNFPNVVKYNPVRASQKMTLRTGDLLYEDTMGLMAEGLEKNIYELLVLDRVATSPDKDMSDLFNFTRLFYRSCRQWMHVQSSDFGPPGDELRTRGWLTSGSFLSGVLDHLNETVWDLSGGGGPAVSMETILAAMVKTGGNGMLTVSLPRRFATDVIENDDQNLTRTVRAELGLSTRHLLVSGREKLENDALFRKTLDFLAKSELGAPLLKFAGRYGNSSGPAFLAESTRIKASLSDDNKYATGECEFPARNNPYAGYEFTVSDLDKISACAAKANSGAPFSWRRFFDALLQAPVDPAALVRASDVKQVVNFVTYMKSRPVFANTSDGGLRLSDDVTFLVFDWLLSFQDFFPRDLQSERIRTGKPQVALAIEGDGVSSCMLWTKTLLQPILERMYQTAYHRKDFADVTQLVKLVKEAAIAGMRRQSWITASAKVAIEKKIGAMKETIGLDELTPGEIKAFYAPTLEEFRGVELRPRNLDASFGTLFSQALCAYAHKNFDVMSGLSPVTMFMEISPLVVNAFNWVERNQIIFPMAILAPPYYHPSFPPYINLGSLGYVIGHEIGHSFDNIGHQINKQGAKGHFWDNETESGYLDRMECVRSRYGGYRLYPGGPLLDSNRTLGNDIADIIGIQAAAGALKLLESRRGRLSLMPRLPNLSADFSPEQQLFIQAAQSWCLKSEPSALDRLFGSWPTHSPHHLRVRGIAENSQEFAKAFKCRRRQPMNPETKCGFW